LAILHPEYLCRFSRCFLDDSPVRGKSGIPAETRAAEAREIPHKISTFFPDSVRQPSAAAGISAKKAKRAVFQKSAIHAIMQGTANDLLPRGFAA
jgi:hypothetical protein